MPSRMKATFIAKANYSRRALLGAYLPALLLGVAALPAWSDTSTWIGATGSWSAGANWDTGLAPVSNTATQLVFNASGNTGYTVTDDIGTGTFTLNRLTVNNTGTGLVTINGLAGANTLTMGGTNATLDITGSVLFNGLFANSATITKTGTGTFIHDSDNSAFRGTLIVDQGTFINRSTTFATTNFNPVSIIVNNGATYQFGDNTIGNPNLPNGTYITINTGGNVVWQEGEDFGGFQLAGGTITLQSGVNPVGTTVQSWTSGTVTTAGTGSFSIAGTAAINKTTSGTVTITGNASLTDTGSLNIQEGTVSFVNAVNLGTMPFTLGDTGGVTSGTFDYQGLSATRAGAVAVNAGGGSINVANSAAILKLTGDFSGTGNLSKTGNGRLYLSGGHNGTGTITAAGGTLQLDPSFLTGNLAVADTATIAVTSGAGFASLNVPSLAFLGGTSTLQFDLDTNAIPFSALAVVSNPDELIFTGTPVLKLTNTQPLPIGTFTLIDYDGAPITSGFALNLPGRTAGSLSYDTESTMINVTITGSDTVKWTGAVNGDWDIGTAANVGGTNNWKLVTAGSATNFINTDTITFDDTATGHNVNLTGTVLPAFTTIDASSNFTFSGPGKISGTTSLTKAGTGTLILATNNDYTGGTVVTGGTLQLGNGGTAGSISGSVSLNNASLGFNRTDDFTLNATVTATGTSSIVQNGAGSVTISTPLNVMSGNTLNKEGTGTLVLLGGSNSTFTGTLNVNAGTVLLNDLGAGGDLGATSIVVNSGGTFIFGPLGNTDFPDATVVTVNAGGLFRIEQGENFGGYILNGGEFRYVSSGLTGVNSTAIASLAGAVVYDLRSGTITTDITGTGTGGIVGTPAANSGILTKTTTGTVTVSGIATFQPALALQIKEGTLAMNPNNVPTTGAFVSLGDVSTAGTLQINGTGTATSSRNFTLNDGGGTINVVNAGTTLTITGALSGTGGITKAGNGKLILTGLNSYTGNTTVTGGTLEVDNLLGSGSGSGQVIINGTLAGDGTIAASSNIVINGPFLPGATGAIAGSDFNLATSSGSLIIFSSASVSKFDLWLTAGADQTANLAAADRLIINGDLEISPGATLALTNPNGILFQDGDVFRLVDWSGATSITGTWNVDASALNLNGLDVNTDHLYTDGTVSLTAVPEPTVGILALFGLATLLRRRRKM